MVCRVRVTYKGESRQDCAKSAKQRLSCEKAKPKVGHRRYEVQNVWSETLSFYDSGFAQQLFSQLRYIQ